MLLLLSHGQTVVANCCFSARAVGPDLDNHIYELNKAFRGLDVSETLKIHVALKHIKDCLQFLGYYGLGLWSEQAGESIHREFLKFWERYKINIIEDSTYATRLKKAIITFSSQHI